MTNFVQAGDGSRLTKILWGQRKALHFMNEQKTQNMLYCCCQGFEGRRGGGGQRRNESTFETSFSCTFTRLWNPLGSQNGVVLCVVRACTNLFARRNLYNSRLVDVLTVVPCRPRSLFVNDNYLPRCAEKGGEVQAVADEAEGYHDSSDTATQ